MALCKGKKYFDIFCFKECSNNFFYLTFCCVIVKNNVISIKK